MAIQITSNYVRRPELSDAYYEYMPEGNFIATKVFKPLAVDEPRGELEKVRADNMLKTKSMTRASNGSYNRVDAMLDVLPYTLQEKGAEHSILFGEKNSIQYNKLLGGINHLKTLRWISRELDFRDVLFDLTTFTPESANSDWASPSSDILGDIMDAMAIVRSQSGMEANALVINRTVLAYVLKNEAIRAQFQGATIVTQAVLEANLPAIFGLEYLYVSGGVQNTATIGDPIVAEQLVPTTLASVCRVASEGAPPQSPAVGRTIYWAEDDTDPIDGVVETYQYDPQRALIVRVRDYQNPILIDENLNVLIDVAPGT